MKARPLILLAATSVAGACLVLLLLRSERGEVAALAPVQKHIPLPSLPAERVASAKRAEGATLPPSFQSARDLYAFSRTALDSKDAGVVFEGYQALRECEALNRSLNSLRAAADGGSTKNVFIGDLTEPRRLAIGDVLGRCEGFAKIDYRELADLRRRFIERGDSLRSVEFRVDGKGQPLRRQEILDLLSSSSPSARAQAVMALPLPSGHGLKADTPSRTSDDLFAMAALLAVCDAGQDCSKDAFGQQLGCVLAGKCGKSVLDDWQHEFSVEEARQIESVRQRLGAALKAGDVGALGL